MMRNLAALVLALALATPAAAECFKVTASGEAAFRAASTAAERRAAARTGYCREVVAEGTFGAIDAGQAQLLLPELRRFLAAQPNPPRAHAKAGRAVKLKAARSPTKAARRALERRTVRHVALPRPRPQLAPAPPAADVAAPPAPIPPPAAPVTELAPAAPETELAPELVAPPAPRRRGRVEQLRDWLRAVW